MSPNGDIATGFDAFFAPSLATAPLLSFVLVFLSAMPCPIWPNREAPIPPPPGPFEARIFGGRAPAGGGGGGGAATGEVVDRTVLKL